MHTLTDTKIRAVGANGKTQRFWDGGGLYLEVNRTGSRWWRLKYRHLKKEKRVSLGTYPSIALNAARDRATEARKLPASGIDVSAERQAVKQSAAQAGTNSFESMPGRGSTPRTNPRSAKLSTRERWAILSAMSFRGSGPRLSIR